MPWRWLLRADGSEAPSSFFKFFLRLEMTEKRKWPKEPVQSISSLGAAVRNLHAWSFLPLLSRVFFSLCKV